MRPFFELGLRQARLLTTEIVATSAAPLPAAKMMRNGVAIGSGFLGFLLAGKIEGALICAFFTNLMMFVDQPGPLRERLIILGCAAGASALSGIFGALAANADVLIFAGTFCLAYLAGFVHGSIRGLDMIPRFAAICFVAGAYLPVVNQDAISGVVIGSLCALGVVAIDEIRHRARNEHTPAPRLLVNYPGFRFSLAYGLAAVCGVALGQAWGDARPYWLTITTLLVMQPDRRTNMFRALQRFVGTIAGVLAAFALIAICPGTARAGMIVALGLVMPFFWPFAYARNYGLGVALLSTWILLLLDLALPQNESIAAILTARLADTTAGCVLALIGSFIYNETSNESG